MKHADNIVIKTDNQKLIDKALVTELCLVFAFFFIRYVACGFKYYPQLDDYIQYHNYLSNFSSQGWGYLNGLGLFNSRPLAAIFDVFVWSNFWGKMIIACAILSMLYSVSAVILRKLFNKYFGTGLIFTVVFCLLPLGYEGLYWISASSRIVCGTFFSALSLLFFDKLHDNLKWYNVVLYAVFQLIGFCFYEQTAFLSIGLIFVFALIKRQKRSLFGLFSFSSLGMYYSWTKLVSVGKIYAERSEMALPFLTKGYFSGTFKSAITQFKQILFNANIRITVNGFVRGVKMIFSGKYLFFTIGLILLIAAVIVIIIRAKRKEESKTKLKYSLPIEFVCGLFLICAAMAPFFMLKGVYLGIRAAAPCFCGIALCADSLIRAISLDKKKICSFIALGLAVVFCLAGLSETYDYKQSYLNDTEISDEIYQATKNYKNKDKICILNLNRTYLTEFNYDFRDHIQGVTASNWALEGAINCNNDITDRCDVYPIPIEPCYYNEWNREINLLSNFDYFFYYDDGELIELTVKQEKEETRFTLYNKNDKKFAVAYEDAEGYGRFELCK